MQTHPALAKYVRNEYNSLFVLSIIPGASCSEGVYMHAGHLFPNSLFSYLGKA